METPEEALGGASAPRIAAAAPSPAAALFSDSAGRMPSASVALAALSRRRWQVGMVALAGAFAAVLPLLALGPDYESQVTLVINRPAGLRS